MPKPVRKMQKANAAAQAAVLPKIPPELLDQLVKGPMTAEAVEDASRAFKKALIERALGAEMTREGMSGSVVVARHFIMNQTYQKKDGSTSQHVLFAKLDLVVGIYSGRHYPDLEKAQLGIVWKRSAIEETVAGQKVAAT